MNAKTKLALGLVVGSAVVAALVFLVVVPAMVDKAKATGEDRVAKRYPAGDIVMQDPMAQSFGLESLGDTQVRGNGALVLSKTTLHFFQASPDREVEVPLSSIVEVSTTKSHLGKTTGTDLLKVTFRAGAGQDSIAWNVKAGAEAWRSKIRELAGK